MTTIVAHRPIAEIKDDIRRYTARLGVNAVLASTRWYAETQDKLTAAKAELASAQGGVR
jgi:hypothetical protein